ncbi:MAG: hypothetical protein HQK78_11270 [Desulfobacterales bacterium]|nr:hypothetical protein [Desulfobacterales bacterium]
MEYENIFEKACLIQISSSIWQCSKVLNQSILEEKFGSNNEWLKGRKYLINPELLGPINTTTHQARNTVQKFALPFPITSIYLVPKDSISMIDNQLQQFKERFWNKVDDFVAIYDVAREEAENVLGELFDETEYPTDVKSKFNFEWRFLVLSVPGKSAILSPEIYEREKEKFQNLMDETREIAMIALREEFADVLTNLTDKLNGNGNGKVLNGSMFNKLNAFLSEFNSKNIFHDDKLKELIKHAKSVISGVSGYNLKYNETLKNTIKNEMDMLKQSVEAAIEDMPRRKLRIAMTANE